MRLNIPDDAKCLTPGCRNSPTHVFSLRMRRQDTGASWAPNIPAYLCDVCANSGADIHITYQPTKTNVVHVDVIGVKRGKVTSRDYDLATKRDVA